ncbi:MAG: hypothetical protein IMF07_04570 [Proteobacteria bacterium]|nr:hypothetical protein [Pseudomonadota bacterium]
MGAPAAIAELKEICAYSWHGESANQAQRALRRRAFSGIDDSNIAAGPPSDLSPERCEVFISPVDSQGDATLCLIVEGKDERSEALCITYNDEVGIIDAYGSRRIKKKEILQMIDEIKTEEAAFVQVDSDYFLQLLNNALSLNEKYDFPLPLELCYRKDMLKGHLAPSPFTPGFRLSLLRRIRKDSSLLKRGAEILEKDAFAEWPLSSYSSFDYAEQWIYTKVGRPLSLMDNACIKQFSLEVLLPNKGLISKRLTFAAYFLEKMGDIDGVELSLASALELHSKRGRQFIEIPFIKELAKKSIEYCATQISEGSDPREYYEDID